MREVRGIRLYDLQKRIKEALSRSFPSKFWIRGEISVVKENPSGHCYLDVIDKDPVSGILNAKAQAIIWSSSWKVLRPYFEKSTGSSLAAGMNILFLAQAQFSEIYGLSLIISDIDPTFSVGEMELQRLRTIERLKEEGMMDMNTTLKLPLLPRKFAVISSETAAGYRDFMKHLHQNIYGFGFSTTLFPAPMQGAMAPEGIIAALERIASLQTDARELQAEVGGLQAGGGAPFDAVLILRGGGSVTDLACFDDYSLAANVAQFPIPVMVAVGHDQDYHVCDMVACISVKTPTALADFLVDIFAAEDAGISSLASRLALAVSNKHRQADLRLENIAGRILSGVRNRMSAERGKVDLLEQRMIKGNPMHLVSAGYAIVRRGGRNVASVSEMERGDLLEVLVKDGFAECEVKKITIFK